MATLLGEIRDRRVTGRVEIHSACPDKRLNFVNVIFEEAVDLSGIRARQIGFYGCTFRKGANLSGIDLSGSLTAYKTSFHGHPRNQPGLRLDAAHLGEGLTIVACNVEGGILAENTRIVGNADFRGVQAYAREGAPLATELQNLADKDGFRRTFGDQYPHLPFAFRLVGSRVEGSLLLSALFDERIKDFQQFDQFPRIAFLGGDVALANVEVAGDLDLSGLVVTRNLSLENSIVKGNINANCFTHAERVVRLATGGSMNLYGIQVGGNLQLPSAHLGSGLHITFGKIGGYLFAKHPLTTSGYAPPLEIGQDDEGVSLDLSGSHIGGVECEGARLDGQVRIATGEFGRFWLTPFANHPDSISPCSTASVVMRSVTIAEGALFSGIQLKPSTAARPITEQGYAGSFRMINCSVGGNLTIGSDGLCRHLWPGLPEERREFPVPKDVRTVFGSVSRQLRGGHRCSRASSGGIRTRSTPPFFDSGT